MASNWKRTCRYCVSDGVPRRACWVAVVVGTILNLINQGDALLAGGPVDLVKLVLTYLVPYGVSTYGAVTYRIHAAGLALVAVPLHQEEPHGR